MVLRGTSRVEEYFCSSFQGAEGLMRNSSRRHMEQEMEAFFGRPRLLWGLVVTRTLGDQNSE